MRTPLIAVTFALSLPINTFGASLEGADSSGEVSHFLAVRMSSDRPLQTLQWRTDYRELHAAITAPRKAAEAAPIHDGDLRTCATLKPAGLLSASRTVQQDPEEPEECDCDQTPLPPECEDECGEDDIELQEDR